MLSDVIKVTKVVGIIVGGIVVTAAITFGTRACLIDKVLDDDTLTDEEKIKRIRFINE